MKNIPVYALKVFFVQYFLFVLIFIHSPACKGHEIETDHGFQEENPDFDNLKLNEKLLHGSRWAIEKAQKAEKIEVFHAIDVVDILKVDVETMSIRVELHLRQRWLADDIKLPEGLFQEGDPEHTFITAPLAILDSIWSPNSYIPNARETKISSFEKEQSVVNIFKNGTIVFKTRLSTILGCSFSFQWYPLDKQSCDLIIESYTSTNKIVKYEWETLQNPVHLSSIQLFQYDIHSPLFYTNGSAERWGHGAQYPYVLLRFSFERKLQHQLIQVFTPTILVVILSWLSFWLGLDAIPGRVSLLITCMLTLVTMHTGLKGPIPPVNYIKMMDVWMVCCMSFVFGAVCEFVIVKYLHWRKQQKQKADEQMEKEVKDFLDKMKENGQKMSNGQQGINPYLEFYKNMRDNDSTGRNKDSNSEEIYLMGLNHRSHPNRKIAWENEYPLPPSLMMRPTGGYYNPLQNKDGYAGVDGLRLEYKKLMRKKKIPIWISIDRVSRVFFPAMFLIFNAAYWPVLLIGSSNQ